MMKMKIAAKFLKKEGYLHLLFDESLAKSGKGAKSEEKKAKDKGQKAMLTAWLFCLLPLVFCLFCQITLSAQHEEANASGLALNTKPMLRI